MLIPLTDLCGISYAKTMLEYIFANILDNKLNSYRFMDSSRVTATVFLRLYNFKTT